MIETTETKLTPKQYYDEHGYYVFKKLIPGQQIDVLLKEFLGQIVPSDKYFFRQSRNQWSKNDISANGFVQSSFLDIHDFGNFPDFSTAAKKIYCSKEMRGALSKVTGSKEHNLMQSMFFDQNTATPAHTDNYYLDSVPTGHLVGAWIALEDIKEEAGRFYVVPDSNKVDFNLSDDEKLANNLFVQKITNYMSSGKGKVVAPALQKGDVLLWNSRTIHGALPTKNPKYSRKSITAHYIPSEMQFGNMFGTPFAVNYSNFEGMKFQRNTKNYSVKSLAKYKVKNFLLVHPTMRRIVDVIKGIQR